MAEKQELITVRAAAERYGVTPTTVYNWIDQKIIDKYETKLPKRTYVDARQIDALREVRPAETEDDKRDEK